MNNVLTPAWQCTKTPLPLSSSAWMKCMDGRKWVMTSASSVSSNWIWWRMKVCFVRNENWIEANRKKKEYILRGWWSFPSWPSECWISHELSSFPHFSRFVYRRSTVQVWFHPCWRGCFVPLFCSVCGEGHSQNGMRRLESRCQLELCRKLLWCHVCTIYNRQLSSLENLAQ